MRERRERIVGIYGFDFTYPFSVSGIEFIPFFPYPESHQRASDPESLEMTGYGRIGPGSLAMNDDADRVRLIVAGMTFVEQQEVVASTLIEMSPGDTVEAFVATNGFRRPLVVSARRESFGDVVAPDVWSRKSRPDFLEAFCSRFSVEQAGDALRQAFFRQIEISRLATPYVEIHHFLAFSALELVARSRGSYQLQKNAAVPIKDLLNGFGFLVGQPEIERWTHARNKAFHEGLLVSPDPQGGPNISLADQLMPITNVLVDVLLKLLPFDDGHINWNRWQDRQPFR